MFNTQNYYQVLGVPQKASELAIKQAFRRLAREYHPDLNPHNPEAEAAFKLVREAYDVLGDRFKRQQYDRYASNEDSSPAFQTDQPGQLTDYEEIYSMGIQLASQRHYELANQRFTQAITLKPTNIEGYMGRCQVRYALGDDRGVLDDCTTILRLKAQVPQAHYYQGRAHQRLNYVDHAIQSYSNAIHLDHSYAAAYLYRGLARVNNNDQQNALADFKAASHLYQASGNHKGLKQAELQISQIRSKARTTSFLRTSDFFYRVLLSVINPAGNLLDTFRSLTPQQAMGAGFALFIVAIAGFVSSALFFWPNYFQFSVFHLLVLGIIPFITIIIMSSLISLCEGNRGGNWSGDIFLAGSTLIPVGMGFFFSGLIGLLGNKFLWSLIFTVICLTVMTLYLGMTQINRLSQLHALFVVPFILLISLWLVEFTYTTFA